MLIGMVTVFIILLVVIYGSKLLISLVNKFAPVEQAPIKGEASSSIPNDVLNAAVAAITGGKGRIVKVTKI